MGARHIDADPAVVLQKTNEDFLLQFGILRLQPAGGRFARCSMFPFFDKGVRGIERSFFSQTFFDTLGNDLGHPSLVAYPRIFHASFDIELYLLIQPKLPGYPRSFVEELFGSTCAKWGKPAKHPACGPEPKIAGVSLLQPAAKFQPGIAYLRLRNIQPTGLVQTYGGKFGRDHNREPMLRPDDVGFNPAGKTRCMSLIRGHTLPEEVFEQRITLQGALMLAKLPERSTLRFPRSSLRLPFLIAESGMGQNRWEFKQNSIRSAQKQLTWGRTML
jgi:hypothetical protein